MLRIIIMLLLAVSSVQAAYITDKLLVGFYAKPDPKTQPIKVLPSSTPLEVLEKKDVFSRVRLGDGKEGWVKSIYISNEKPARAMLLEQQAKSSSIQNKLRQMEKQLKAAQGGNPAAAAGDSSKLKSDLDQYKKKLLDTGAALKTAQAENSRLKALVKQSGSKKQPAKSQSKELKAMKKKLTASESDLKATMHEVQLLQDLLKKSDQTASQRIASLEAQLNKARKTGSTTSAASDKALAQENTRLRQQLQKISAILGTPQSRAAAPTSTVTPATQMASDPAPQPEPEKKKNGKGGFGTWLFIAVLLLAAGYIGFTTIRNLHLRRRYKGFRI